MKIPVYANTGASFYIGSVDINSPEEFYDAAEKLWESKGWESPMLCHQCSEIDLGDFEIDDTQLDFYFKDKK